MTTRNERGQVIIFVAVMFMVLMFFFALVANVAQSVQSRQRTQGAADFSALAGATVQAEGLNEIARLNDEIKGEYLYDLACMQGSGLPDACPFHGTDEHEHGRLFEGGTREEALSKARQHYSEYYNTPPPEDLGILSYSNEQVYINYAYAEAAWRAARIIAFTNGIYDAYIDAKVWEKYGSPSEELLEEINLKKGDLIQDMTGLYSEGSYRLCNFEDDDYVRRLGPRMRFCLHYNQEPFWEHGLLTPEEAQLWIERISPEEELGWTTHFCLQVTELSKQGAMFFGKGLLDIEIPPLAAVAQAVAEGGKIDFESSDDYYPSLVPVNTPLEPPNRLSEFYSDDEIARILH